MYLSSCPQTTVSSESDLRTSSTHALVTRKPLKTEYVPESGAYGALGHWHDFGLRIEP